MVEPETMSMVLARLQKEGYTEDFRVNKDGRMRCTSKDLYINPEDLLVDKIYRFEGETDLNDEEIVFALSSAQHNIKGTYVVAFGPMMDPLDAAVVQRLERKTKLL